MSLFSRLFKAKTERSPLEEFLSELTRDSIRAASLGGRDEETRVATAVSLLVLLSVYRFSKGLIHSAANLSRSIRSLTGLSVPFDVVAFETAAFTHHALLAPYLQDSAEEEHDEEGSEDDPYFSTLTNAAHLSAAVISKFTSFDLPDSFFINRCMSYELTPKRGSPLRDRAIQFELILSGSIEGGTPKTGLKGSLSDSLGVTMALKTSIPPYCVDGLPALSASARAVFASADDLGLSD